MRSPGRSPSIRAGGTVPVAGQVPSRAPSNPPLHRDHWPLHLLAAMVAALGALLLVTFSVIAAANVGNRGIESAQEQPATPGTAAAAIQGATGRLAGLAGGSGFDSVSHTRVKDRDARPLPAVAGPEPGPVPREVVFVVREVPALPPMVAPKPVAACGKFGTRVAFEATGPDAFARAKAENKLVFVMHLSGNFEDPGFT